MFLVVLGRPSARCRGRGRRGGLRRGRLRLLTKARVQQYTRGYDLSGVMELPPLGFIPATGHRAGLAAMLDDFRQQPLRERSTVAA